MQARDPSLGWTRRLEIGAVSEPGDNPKGMWGAFIQQLSLPKVLHAFMCCWSSGILFFIQHIQRETMKLCQYASSLSGDLRALEQSCVSGFPRFQAATERFLVAMDAWAGPACLSESLKG